MNHLPSDVSYESDKNLICETNGVFQMPRTPTFRVSLVTKFPVIAFQFVFVIASCHLLVIVIVSHISLFSKPAQKRTTQLYILLHAQQDRAMHTLVTGIK